MGLMKQKICNALGQEIMPQLDNPELLDELRLDAASTLTRLDTEDKCRATINVGGRKATYTVSRKEIIDLLFSSECYIGMLEAWISHIKDIESVKQIVCRNKYRFLLEELFSRRKMPIDFKNARVTSDGRVVIYKIIC